MPRPSRKLDVQLLAAGRELYPETGCAGLSVRKVAERAGANLGMFHYHFGSKDAFVRELLQSLYERMFAALEVAASTTSEPVEALRASVEVIARFGRDHRRLLRRLILDAMSGETVPLEFVRENLPRHVGVVLRLIEEGQRRGVLRPMPIAQAIGFLAGAVAAPILFGATVVEAGYVPDAITAQFEAEVLSDEALRERIGLALYALAQPGGAAP
jgi:AcrR family transcriptional regulator